MKTHAVACCTVVQLCFGTFIAIPGIAQADGKLSDQTVLGVQCSQIFELGIDKQENLRATMIRVACGMDAPGFAGQDGEGIESPEDFTNINLITGGETLPHVTQS